MNGILAKIKREFKVKKSEIFGEGMKRSQVNARCAYYLCAHILDEKEVYGTENSMLYFIDKATTRFRKNIVFRESINNILGGNDRYKQFALRNPCETARIIQKITKAERPERVVVPRSERGKTMHSFNFTSDEEIEIAKACEGALEYFEKYGKGHEPDRVLMVNKSRYDY